MSAYGLPGSLTLCGTDGSRGVLTVSNGELLWNGQPVGTGGGTGGAGIQFKIGNYESWLPINAISNLSSGDTVALAGASLADAGLDTPGLGISLDWVIYFSYVNQDAMDTYGMLTLSAFVEYTVEGEEVNLATTETKVIIDTALYDHYYSANMHLSWIAPSVGDDPKSYVLALAAHWEGVAPLSAPGYILQTDMQVAPPEATTELSQALFWNITV
jgi:hypothetical protein